MAIKNSITIDDAIEVLNRALEKDQEAVSNLMLSCNTLCNTVLARDPSIQVQPDPNTLGPFGIINGLFGADDKTSRGPISMRVDEDAGVTCFLRTPPEYLTD